MLALLALVASVGLADSLNPSTIVPGLYYATTARGRAAVASFALGAFAAYLAGGVVVLLGGRELVTSLVPHVGERAQHLIELGAGAALVAVAAGVWLLRTHVDDRAARPRDGRPWSAFAVGAAIMAVELPTAFPYFAAIAAIATSDVSVPGQLALVALYNVLFVLPLVGILAATALAGDRGAARLRAVRDWTQRHAAAVLAVTLAAIGVVAIGIGIAGLA